MGSKNYSKAVEDIKSTVSIVDVIGSCISIKRAGSNYKACCPFHKEKTPSFIVSDTKNTYHCYGCGEHGDAISFIEKYYNIDFPQAVERIAAQYGITIEETKDVRDKKKDEYYNANRLAARYFFDCLSKTANKGYTYMSGRGLSAKTMQYFGIGYSGDTWTGLTDHLLSNGISKETIITLGLSAEKNGKVYDKFRSRVMFPIIDIRGKVIGFGGRIIGDGEPKYLNSPESSIYLKKNNLYGINRAKDAILKNDYAILVEGYMDCISLFQSGIENAVASCGTALTNEQAKLIKRYSKNVVLCYDSDKAGIAAALRGIDILRDAGMDVRVLNVDDGKDPDEYIKKHGKDSFLDLLDKKALPGVEYKVKILRNSYDLSDNTQGIRFFKELAGIIRSLSPVEADIYIQKYSKEFGISEGAMRREVENAKPENNSRVNLHQRVADPEKPAKLNIRDVNLERMIIRLILFKSSNLEDFRKYPEAFVTEKGKTVFRVFEENYIEGTEFDIKQFADDLSEDEMYFLEQIMEKIQIGDDSRAFSDCMQRLENNRKQKRIDEINDIIQMSDALPEEDINQDLINDLLKELQSLQINRNEGDK